MAKYVLQHIPPPVLVEDGLGVRFTLTKGNIFSKVLILVLVEDGLGDSHKLHYKPAKIGLNPCFSGGWSRRSLNHTGSVTVTES